MIVRKECCICKNSLEDIFELKNYPLFFALTDNTNFKYDTLVISKCKECFTLQFKNLLELDDIYVNPHNSNVVGNLWINHFIELSNFINLNKSGGKNILEIGSPTDKICKYIKDYSKYYLLDPNAVNYDNDKIINLNTFFKEDTKFDFSVDTIIHSHLFEHLYNPYEILLNMSNVLDDNGDMFISVPNMQFSAFTDNNLFSGMHFEHTYFLNDINILYLFSKCNLRLVGKKYYNNHSIFYHLKKLRENQEFPLNIVKEYNLAFEDLLMKKIEDSKNLVKKINDFILDKKNIYIFGCHSNNQALLYLGINTENIKNILDNDSSKHDKYYYGYPLIVKSPGIIKDIENPIVICHAGFYSEEIKKQLLKINPNSIVI